MRHLRITRSIYQSFNRKPELGKRSEFRFQLFEASSNRHHRSHGMIDRTLETDHHSLHERIHFHNSMLETLLSEASNESKAPHHQPLPNNRPRWDEILHSSFTFVADSPCLVGPCASWSLCQLSKEWRDALDTGRGDLWVFASCDLSCDSYRSSINDKSFEEEPSRQHASTKTLTYKSKRIISMPIYSSLTKHT